MKIGGREIKKIACEGASQAAVEKLKRLINTNFGDCDFHLILGSQASSAQEKTGSNLLMENK